jgi:hypothetical protein
MNITLFALVAACGLILTQLSASAQDTATLQEKKAYAIGMLA